MLGHRSHMHALIGYLEALKVTQGRHAGECLTVLPWQRQFLRMAFGAPGDSSLSLARANGKSTFVAALGCAFLDGPLRQPRAEVVIVASSFLQARIVFDHLLGFMGERAGNRKVWRLWDSTPIRSLASHTHRRVRALHRERSQADARARAGPGPGR